MNIKLNDQIKMDLVKFRDGKMLLQANTGGGKSWAIRRILEQSFDKIPQIILDTEGEFSTLRQKFDYILIGKGHEIVADHKTAALLAHRLIKERVSAIIDLFEMSPWERETFVKNFIEAMTNAPKELWLPTLLVVDEAQTYAPEGDKTECGRTLHDAAFKFRKRHYGILFATPRIAALSKNIISTCKNKLIGYTSYEGDVKRAAFELGFTTKEDMRSLRDLDPGQFFGFGPAISKEVIRVQIGKVETAHGDEDDVRTELAPASAKVKKALAALADLPQAAAEEARTIAEFRSENASLKREIGLLKRQPIESKINEIKVPVLKDEQIARLEKVFGSIKKEAERHEATMKIVWENLNGMGTVVGEAMRSLAGYQKPVKTIHQAPILPKKIKPGEIILVQNDLTGPEQKILNAIAWLESIGVNEPDATAVAFLAGYTYGGGGFNNPKGSLRSKGLIEYRAGSLVLTEKGVNQAKIPETPLTTEELHTKVFSVLPGPEQRLLKPLLEAYPNDLSNEELAGASGYQVGSGGFNNPKGRLRTLGLADYPSPGRVKASHVLFLV